jgi:hypothetical protein
MQTQSVTNFAQFLAALAEDQNKEIIKVVDNDIEAIILCHDEQMSSFSAPE